MVKRKVFVLLLAALLCVAPIFASGAKEGSDDDVVEISFIQWWEPELPEGSLRAIMDEFEAANPDIKVTLISGPNASIYDQIIAGTATGTLADVVGMDGKWAYDLTMAGGVIPLDDYLAESPYTEDISIITKVHDDSIMFPLVTFLYPLYCNMDLLNEAGYTEPPKNRTEFAEMAKAVTNPAENKYGWILPMPVQSSTGLRVEVMSLYWANGYSMLKDGKPNLTNQHMYDVLNYTKDLYDTAVSPGAFAKMEQDKNEEFANGNAAFAFSSLAALNMLLERNPDLNLVLTDVPAEDDYTGQRGIRYADWGVGISASSDHPDEAWRLIEYLISPEVNQKFASLAKGFPGNTTVVPDWVDDPNPIYQQAFDIFQRSTLVNEYLALPNSDEMGRRFATEIQKFFDGQCTAEEACQAAQDSWNEIWV